MGIDNVQSKNGLPKSTFKRKKLLSEIEKHKYLYLLLLPGIIYFVIFKYLPILWLGISFQDYKLLKGIGGSEWVGLKNYIEFFSNPDCWLIIRNTLILNFYSIIFEFPSAVIFALILNEVKNVKFKKTIQTVTYLPHFISTVVLVGMLNTMLSSAPPGIVYKLVSPLLGKGGTLLGEEAYFRTIYTVSSIWQQTGWNAIIYLAALSGIDPTYYEAAVVDGAGRFKQMIHITLPCIMGTVVIMFIMKIGNIMTVGFEKAYLMQTDSTRQVSEIISTYVYKRGLAGKDYSYATAVGLFNSVIGFILVIVANNISKRVSENSLW